MDGSWPVWQAVGKPAWPSRPGKGINLITQLGSGTTPFAY